MTWLYPFRFGIFRMEGCFWILVFFSVRRAFSFFLFWSAGKSRFRGNESLALSFIKRPDCSFHSSLECNSSCTRPPLPLSSVSPGSKDLSSYLYLPIDHPLPHWIQNFRWGEFFPLLQLVHSFRKSFEEF